MKTEHSEKNLLMQIANGFRASRGIRKNLDGEALVELANQIVESKPEQEKTVEIIENGTMEIAADEGKALSKVTAVVSVLTSTANKLSQIIEGTVTELTAEDLAGVTKIGKYAFSYGSSLKSITIPDSITNIDERAFHECHNLTSVTIGNGVFNIGDYAFCRCSSLTSVTIGDSVWKIKSGAFQDCSSLTSIIIPNSVISINTSAFERCTNLTNVTIGDGVTSIGSWGLEVGSSTNKATIIFLGIEPPSIQNLTFKTAYLNKIIVPKGCGEVYKAATNWANFADFIEEAAE